MSTGAEVVADEAASSTTSTGSASLEPLPKLPDSLAREGFSFDAPTVDALVWPADPFGASELVSVVRDEEQETKREFRSVPLAASRRLVVPKRFSSDLTKRDSGAPAVLPLGLRWLVGTNEHRAISLFWLVTAIESQASGWPVWLDALVDDLRTCANAKEADDWTKTCRLLRYSKLSKVVLDSLEKTRAQREAHESLLRFIDLLASHNGPTSAILIEAGFSHHCDTGSLFWGLGAITVLLAEFETAVQSDSRYAASACAHIMGNLAVEPVHRGALFKAGALTALLDRFESYDDMSELAWAICSFVDGDPVLPFAQVSSRWGSIRVAETHSF